MQEIPSFLSKRKNMTKLSKYYYNSHEIEEYYKNSAGVTALCYTCVNDGFCMCRMRFKKCKNYIKRREEK